MAIDGFWLADTRGRFLDVNEAYCRMSGYGEQELLSMHISDVEAAEKPDETAAHMQSLMTRGYDRFETLHRRKDGTVFEVEVSTQYRPLEDGRVVAFLRDITERKEAEEALRASEERFRTLFSRHSAPMLLIEPESGLILDANDAASAFYGYDKAAFRSMSIDGINLLPPEEVAAERTRALRESRNYFVFRHRLSSGDVRVVEVHSSPIDLPQGKVLFSVIHDITGRKVAEEKVRRQAELLALAQHSAKAGTWYWEVSSGQLDWSPEMFTLFGLDPDADGATFDAWRRTLHPDDREAAERRIESALQKRDFLDSEYRIVLSDGQTRWIQALGKAEYDAAGQPLRMTGLCVDATGRKRAEAELRESRAVLQAAMDQSPAGIAVADVPDGRLRYVNDAGLLIRGGTRETIVDGVGIEQYVSAWQLLDLDGRPLKPDEVPLARAVLFGETCSRSSSSGEAAMTTGSFWATQHQSRTLRGW